MPASGGRVGALPQAVNPIAMARLEKRRAREIIFASSLARSALFSRTSGYGARFPLSLLSPSFRALRG
jgi:hypothetical protein